MQGYPDKLLKNNALKIDTRGHPDKLMKKREIRVYWGLRGAGVVRHTDGNLCRAPTGRNNVAQAEGLG